MEKVALVAGSTSNVGKAIAESIVTLLEAPIKTFAEKQSILEYNVPLPLTQLPGKPRKDKIIADLV